jgi:iron(III) transport system permease protein
VASNAAELLAPGAGVDALAPTRTAVPRPSRRLVLPALAIAALFAAPLAYLLWENLARRTNVVDVLGSEDALGPLSRTLVLATTVSLLAAALGTVLAWLTVRTDLPGRRTWRVLLTLPLVVPSFVGALALLSAFAPGGLVELLLGPVGLDRAPRFEGFWAATLVLTLLTYPYVYLPVAARLAVLPPSLEESARSLGRRPWSVFRTVVLPQVSGAMWAGALLVFLYGLSEFGAVQLLRYDTLTRAIYSARLFDRDVSLALGLLLAVVALVVAGAERGIARRRIVTEAGGGEEPLRAALGRWRIPALATVAAVVGAGLVVPVVVLLHWTLRGALGDVALHPDRLPSAATTSALLGVASALVAVAAVLPLAYLTARYRSRAGDAASTLVVSGFALPGLVVALSLVFFVLQAPVASGLYQTYALLVFAYVVHFGSQAMRAGQVAVGGVPRRVDDAARSLGAGRLRRLLTVELPLMRGGLAAGAGLVLLSTMKELPATLILRPLGAETLATRVWAASSEGFYAEAGLAALVLVAVSGVLTWALTIRNLERVR